MKFVSVIALGLLASSAISSANAASFNCDHPNLSSIENVICKIPDLSAMDDQLADAYKAVRHIPEVRIDQKAFIHKRNSLITIDALRTIHQDRIIELQMIAELEGITGPEVRAEQVLEIAQPSDQPRVYRAPKNKQKSAPKPGSAADLISQARAGNKLSIGGKVGYMDYRDKQVPNWVYACSSRIVRNDIMGKWIARARKEGVIKEFKSVEFKLETGFINITTDSLRANLGQSRAICDAIAAGVM
ncbi:hypothetical protein UGMREWDR_CDS0095 [Aeromonas phage GomatiRiver_11]|nr:hypothetical protein OBDJBBDK_00088 [Aeromonas phage AhFM11]WKW84262.1 hypothetical protein UGMREWDR_CDS0095 [Aeromonas phage GomatiRiver_11]